MKIVQIVPTLIFGDAVGNDVRALKKIISEKGYKTQIYAENIDSRLSKETALSISKFPRLSKEDVIIFHESIATDLNQWIQTQPCRKVMIYHNITPPEFFKPYSRESFAACARGYDEVGKLTESFDMILSDSAYNRQNLTDMGFRCPNHVLPILIPFDDYKKEPSRKILNEYGAPGWTNIIFVGRVVPNKCHEDVIAAFHEYQKYFNPKSRLFLVGSLMGTYANRLKEYAARLGTQNVVFTGHCPFEEILAYYHLADIFLCQSEHEGFCVPLVEAMFFDVPIVAYDSSAIGETLGGGGFLLKEKEPFLTAGAMHRVLSDGALRQTIVQNQRERLADFEYEKVKALFWKYMDEFLGAGE